MLTTGIALLPALYEQQEENEEDDDEEEEDDEYDDDEESIPHQVMAMTAAHHHHRQHQCLYSGSGDGGGNQSDNENENDDEEDDIENNNSNVKEATNCLSLCSAAGGGNNSAAARHDLSVPESDPTAEQNNKSSIINLGGGNCSLATPQQSSSSDASSYSTHQQQITTSADSATISRSPSVILTTNMALDSFRRSVCIENDANIDLDAILNDLESLTQMLKSELRPVPASEEPAAVAAAAVAAAAVTQQKQPAVDLPSSCQTAGLPRSGSSDSGSCCPSSAAFLPGFVGGVELRRKPTSTAGVSPTKGVVVEVGHHHLPINAQQHTSWNSVDFGDHPHAQHHQPSPPQGTTGSNRASIGDSDSAFSESGSTPTGSAGVGSTGAGGSSGSVANSISNHQQLVNSSPTSQISALTNGDDDASRVAKEEKIRIALEKIREAQIRKLCIRIFGPDVTTSKTLFIDETTTVRQVIHLLAAKNHVEPNVNWAVVEYYPDLYCHRVIEDHESLVANMLQWKPDSPNSVRFEMRHEKYDLFARPELYLGACGEDESSRPYHANFDHARRLQLVQECFSDISVRLPHLELSLHLKHPSKKSWRKLTFFMRGSGLYYTTKSKGKASAKDLVCLAQFEHVNLYVCSPDYQKKFKAPTPYGFVLKHPQLQKRCKYVHYLCADTEQDLARWCMCIRLAKYGKQMAENYATLAQDIAAWPSERGLSAAGLLQKVTGIPAPLVTPLRHSFTPSIGSGTTLTDDRSTPSSTVMSTSAAARLAASAEQLVIINTPSELIQQYQQHRQFQYQLNPLTVHNDYEAVAGAPISPKQTEDRATSPQGQKPPQNGSNSAKKKHIRFLDDPESMLTEANKDHCPVYDNAMDSAIWRQTDGLNVGQMVLPPPPPPLCHEYDVIAERPMHPALSQQPQNCSSLSTNCAATNSAQRLQLNAQHHQQFVNNNAASQQVQQQQCHQQFHVRAASPRRLPSPQPSTQTHPSEQVPHDADGCCVSPKQPTVVVATAHSEMQYGIIVKPPVPTKPRYQGALSPQNADAANGVDSSKPPPPPRVTSYISVGSGMQKNSIGTCSASSVLNGRQTSNGPALPSRPLIDITGELDKLLSARAARLERLWNQEDGDSNYDVGPSSSNYPPPSTMLMASQELTSEETGTIKKRPPPPPRRNDCQTSPYHHQY